MIRLAQGNLCGILCWQKPQFEIDLQVEGVSQDAITQDEEQMKEVNNKLE